MKRTLLLSILMIALAAAQPGVKPVAERHPNLGVGAGPAIPLTVTHACDGEISAPVDIRVQIPQTITANRTVKIRGTVHMRADAPEIAISFGASGPVTVTTKPIFSAPNFAGEEIPFEVNAHYNGNGRAAVSVLVEARDELGAALYSERETLYALVRPEGTLAGLGGFMDLDRQAVLSDTSTGLMSAEAATDASLELVRMRRAATAATASRTAPTAEQQRLNLIVGAPALGYASGSGTVIESHGPVGIQISGNVQWQDENGVFHPVFGATVQIWDEDTGPDEFVTAVPTDAAGDYSVVVDNDDGVGAGDRDVYVRILTANNLVDCQNLSGDTYFAESAVHDETPDGTDIVEDFTFTAGGTNDSLSVFQAGTWIGAYVAFDVEPGPLPQVDLVWPNGDTLSFYDGQVKIEEPDRYDWDTVHHEFGHYVMDRLGIQDNPGGMHDIGDCIVMIHGNDKDEGNRLAWAEGWPTFFGISGQMEMGLASLNVPRVGDTSYQDVEDGNVVYSMESQSSSGIGEDNELAVQRLLWDLYDSASDSRDAISRSDNSIWDTIKAAAGAPQIFSHYWGALRSGQANPTQLLMGDIATDHQIGPGPIAPAAGSLVTPSNTSFSWNAYVGCPGSYSGDLFDLVFYDAAGNNILLTIPGLTMPSYDLSLAELQGLSTVTHDVRWAVEGSHTPSPATGPYLGENFAIVVNQPPVADAGMDVTAECTSPTATPVMLDGTGSSDPDGDALTFSWSAPGVTFDDSTSPTPTGQFPISTTTATLTVSDGIQDDSDDVDVTVVDTTPPIIACPAPALVECSATGGTPADDPQLDPFFAGVSATDLCDASVDIMSDAPAFFPLGVTTVTFTATDDAGNTATCSATVTVQDTTPPEIMLSVDPKVLWPPDHKMRNVTSTVSATDICDPSPDIFLTSIVSDEPDNGRADGNTVDDIQGDDIGTDDREYELRAERSGRGDGRTYTITHTAVDDSMNSTPASDTVDVPHDRRGGNSANAPGHNSSTKNNKGGKKGRR